MKKSLVLLLTCLFSVSMIYGQTQQKAKAQSMRQKSEMVPLKKLAGTEINPMAKTNFTAFFGNIPGAQWKRTDYFDEVSFTKDGKAMVAFYDSEGNLVGTTEGKNYTDLPKKAQQEIKTKYQGYVPGAIIFFKDNEINRTDMILYGQQFEDEDNYFVEMTKAGKSIVAEVSPEGEVTTFVELK